MSRGDLFDVIDWAELREQKQWLVQKELEGSEEAAGLVNFLDSLMDYVADDLGLGNKLVFDLDIDPEDDTEYNTPCIICGSKDVPLHVSGRCGNCGPGPTDN